MIHLLQSGALLVGLVKIYMFLIVVYSRSITSNVPMVFELSGAKSNSIVRKFVSRCLCGSELSTSKLSLYKSETLM